MTPATRAYWPILLVLIVTSIGAGCAPAAAGGPRRNPDLISAEEIASSNVSSAFDLVQRLRPQWLRPRSQGVTASIYVDELRFGEVESLRTLPAQTVAEIEWIDSGEATQRWGTGNAGGAILVRTRRGA